MTITLQPDLERTVKEYAQRERITPEAAVDTFLREKFALGNLRPIPQDDWERLVLSLGKPLGGALPDEALSSEGLYD